MVVGGIGDTDNAPPSPNIEIITSKNWSQCPVMPDIPSTKLNGLSSGLIDGIPTVCGGYDPISDKYSQTCYKYNVEINHWEFAADLEFGVAFPAYAPWKNSILVAGGQITNGDITARFQVPGRNPIQQIGLAVTCSCMVPLPDGTFMRIGGRTNTG